MKRNVFVQSELLDDICVIEADHDIGAARLREMLLHLVPAGGEVVHVFVEDDEDEQALERLPEVPEGLRVHLHRHKGIEAIVRYAGREVHRTFRPSVTVARVKQWATEQLGITASDAAELMMQVAGTDNRPDADTHIGSLAKGSARVLFDLVPSPRING